MPDEATKENPMEQRISDLPGLSPERCNQLTRLKCLTLEDLLLLKPRRYEDRRNIEPICDLSSEESGLACGKIIVCGTKRLRNGRRLFEFILEDASGQHC